MRTVNRAAARAGALAGGAMPHHPSPVPRARRPLARAVARAPQGVHTRSAVPRHHTNTASAPPSDGSARYSWTSCNAASTTRNANSE